MTISVRFDKAVEERLSSLASMTGRTVSYYVREAVAEKLEDLEDVYIAERRLEKRGETISMEELERDLGLAD